MTSTKPRTCCPGLQQWRKRLPNLVSPRLELREVRPSDAPALLAMFRAPEVVQFLSPTPSTLDRFCRFARWARTERRAGRYLCYVAVERSTGALVGVFQLWPLEPSFATAEWGLAIAQPFWGRGFFAEASTLVVDFAVRTLGVYRLEARVAEANARGNRAFAKLGAFREGVLRQCCRCAAGYVDHVMWAILADEWQKQAA